MSTPTIEKINIFDTGYVEITEEKVDLSKKAHIISPAKNVELWELLGRPDDMRELVWAAKKNSWQLTALCQYTWVPTSDGAQNGVCGACMTIAESWIAEDEG